MMANSLQLFMLQGHIDRAHDQVQLTKPTMFATTAYKAVAEASLT